jgi:hypothetical protein
MSTTNNVYNQLQRHLAMSKPQAEAAEQKIKDDKDDDIVKDYFSQKDKDENVIVTFTNDSLPLLKDIYKNSFPGTQLKGAPPPPIDNYFTVQKNLICAAIQHILHPKDLSKFNCCSTTCQEYPPEKKIQKWLTCDNYCYEQLTVNINHETRTTAFYLHLLVNSIIYIPKPEQPKKLELKLEVRAGYEITGVFDEDKVFIDIPNIKTDMTAGNSKSRLIMGFGPSASGKTFMTEEVIKLFLKIDTHFPNQFITIDGGKIREVSKIYRMIVEEISKFALGIKNLMRAGSVMRWIGQKVGYYEDDDLFLTGEIKRIFTNFLRIKCSKESECTWTMSLYVPDTFGSCNIYRLGINSCLKKIKDYEFITQDKEWIGLNIWQHRTHEECDKTLLYKCVGTTASGKAREKTEGKPYSSEAWGISKRNGYAMINRAPGYRLDIHNSGIRNRKSIITDLTPGSIFKNVGSNVNPVGSNVNPVGSNVNPVGSNVNPVGSNVNPDAFIDTKLFHYCRDEGCLETLDQYHKKSAKIVPSQQPPINLSSMIRHFEQLKRYLQEPQTNYFRHVNKIVIAYLKINSELNIYISQPVQKYVQQNIQNDVQKYVPQNVQKYVPQNIQNDVKFILRQINKQNPLQDPISGKDLTPEQINKITIASYNVLMYILTNILMLLHNNQYRQINDIIKLLVTSLSNKRYWIPTQVTTPLPQSIRINDLIVLIDYIITHVKEKNNMKGGFIIYRFNNLNL